MCFHFTLTEYLQSFFLVTNVHINDIGAGEKYKSPIRICENAKSIILHNTCDA